MGLNRCEVEGLVGKDGETRTTTSGTVITSFSVAWNDYRDGKSGPTTWFRVSAFGKYAESLSGKIKKGMKVIVAGRVELREFEKRDGGSGTSLEIAADFIRVLEQQRREQPAPAAYSPPESVFDDSSIPF